MFDAYSPILFQVEMSGLLYLFCICVILLGVYLIRLIDDPVDYVLLPRFPDTHITPSTSLLYLALGIAGLDEVYFSG